MLVEKTQADEAPIDAEVSLRGDLGYPARRDPRERTYRIPVELDVVTVVMRINVGSWRMATLIGVAHIRVSIIIDRPPSVVWRGIEDIASHVNWMADAEAIRFTSSSTRGVGTTFDCDTKIGPFRLTDRMEITEWDEGRAVGVRHHGLVAGVGRFTLQRTAGGGTLFSWEEELDFPWWLGGPLGEAIGGPLVLKRIWQGNLRHLKERLERHQPANGAS